MMDIQEDIITIKEKIIKTDNILQRFSDVKAKYNNLLQKYKLSVKEYEMLKLEHDAKNFVNGMLSKEIEQLKTDNSKLSSDYNCLKSSHDHDLDQLVNLQMKYQSACKGLSDSENLKEKLESLESEDERSKKRVKKRKPRRYDFVDHFTDQNNRNNSTDIESDTDRNKKILNNSTDTKSNSIKIEILAGENITEQPESKNFEIEFGEDLFNGVNENLLAELKKSEEEKNICIETSKAKELAMYREWREKETMWKKKIKDLEENIELEKQNLNKHWEEKEKKMKRKLENMEQKLKKQAADIKEITQKKMSVLSDSFENKIYDMKTEWKKREEELKKEIVQLKQKIQDEKSIVESFEQKEKNMILSWQEEEQRWKMKISNLEEKLLSLEKGKQSQNRVMNHEHIGINKTHIISTFENCEPNNFENSIHLTNLQQNANEISDKEQTEDESEDIFKTMTLRLAMISPIPELPLELEYSLIKDETIHQENETLFETTNKMVHQISEKFEGSDWRDRYEANRKKKQVNFHKLSVIKKAKQKFWLLQAIRQKENTHVRKNSPLLNLSELSTGNSNSLIDDIANLVSKKLQPSRSRTRTSKDWNTLEVNKMLLEKAKQENETKSLYKIESLYRDLELSSDDDNSVMRENEGSGVIKTQDSNNVANAPIRSPYDSHISGIDTPIFVDSCYESISNPLSIESSVLDNLSEDNKGNNQLKQKDNIKKLISTDGSEAKIDQCTLTSSKLSQDIQVENLERLNTKKNEVEEFVKMTPKEKFGSCENKMSSNNFEKEYINNSENDQNKNIELELRKEFNNLPHDEAKDIDLFKSSNFNMNEINKKSESSEQSNENLIKSSELLEGNNEIKVFNQEETEECPMKENRKDNSNELNNLSDVNSDEDIPEKVRERNVNSENENLEKKLDNKKVQKKIEHVRNSNDFNECREIFELIKEKSNENLNENEMMESNLNENEMIESNSGINNENKNIGIHQENENNFNSKLNEKEKFEYNAPTHFSNETNIQLKEEQQAINNTRYNSDTEEEECAFESNDDTDSDDCNESLILPNTFEEEEDIMEICNEIMNGNLDSHTEGNTSTDMKQCQTTIDHPTIAYAPHCIASGFKNLLAIAAATDVEFKEAETIKEHLKDQNKSASSDLHTEGNTLTDMKQCQTAIDHPTVSSAPDSIASGFKNLLAIDAATDVEFKEAETIKDHLKDSNEFASSDLHTEGNTLTGMKQCQTAIDHPIMSSACDSIASGFKNLLAITAATDVEFKEAETIKKHLKDSNEFASSDLHTEGYTLRDMKKCQTAIDHPTVSSAPDSIASGFKNLLAIDAATDVEFKEAETIKDHLKDSNEFASSDLHTEGNTLTGMKQCQTAIDHPIMSSACDSIASGFKNLLAITAATDVEFKEAETIKKHLKDSNEFASSDLHTEGYTLRDMKKCQTAIDHPTVSSAPDSIASGFKNLLAIDAATDVEFKEAETIKEHLKDSNEFASSDLHTEGNTLTGMKQCQTAIDHPIMSSACDSIASGFKNLLAIAAATDVEFKEAETIKEHLKDSNEFASSDLHTEGNTLTGMKQCQTAIDHPIMSFACDSIASGFKNLLAIDAATDVEFKEAETIKEHLKDSNEFASSDLHTEGNTLTGMKQCQTAIDHPIMSSACDSIASGFKNLLAIAAATDVEFKEAETIKDHLKDSNEFASSDLHTEGYTLRDMKKCQTAIDHPTVSSAPDSIACGFKNLAIAVATNVEFKEAETIKKHFKDPNTSASSDIDNEENILTDMKQCQTAIDHPTVSSAPDSIASGFKKLLAIAAATDVEFKEAETIKEQLKDPNNSSSSDLCTEGNTLIDMKQYQTAIDHPIMSSAPESIASEFKEAEIIKEHPKDSIEFAAAAASAAAAPKTYAQVSSKEKIDSFDSETESLCSINFQDHLDDGTEKSEKYRLFYEPVKEEKNRSNENMWHMFSNNCEEFRMSKAFSQKDEYEKPLVSITDSRYTNKNIKAYQRKQKTIIAEQIISEQSDNTPNTSENTICFKSEPHDIAKCIDIVKDSSDNITGKKTKPTCTNKKSDDEIGFECEPFDENSGDNITVKKQKLTSTENKLQDTNEPYPSTLEKVSHPQNTMKSSIETKNFSQSSDNALHSEVPPRTQKRKRCQKSALMTKSIRVYNLRNSAINPNRNNERKANDSLETRNNDQENSSNFSTNRPSKAKRRRLSPLLGETKSPFKNSVKTKNLEEDLFGSPLSPCISDEPSQIENLDCFKPITSTPEEKRPKRKRSMQSHSQIENSNCLKPITSPKVEKKTKRKRSTQSPSKIENSIFLESSTSTPIEEKTKRKRSTQSPSKIENSNFLQPSTSTSVEKKTRRRRSTQSPSKIENSNFLKPSTSTPVEDKTKRRRSTHSPSQIENSNFMNPTESSPIKKKAKTRISANSNNKLEATILMNQDTKNSESLVFTTNLISDVQINRQSQNEVIPSTDKKSKIKIIQDIILKSKNKSMKNAEPKLGGFKRPIRTKILPACPQSPPLYKEETTSNHEPVIIPLDKPTKLDTNMAASLFRNLITYSTEEKTVEEVARHFCNQEVDYISRLIMQQIIQDKEKPDAKVTRAPLMTDTQRVMLGFMLKLEKMNVHNLINTYLKISELYLIRTNELETIESLTRMNVAICKSHGYIERMRKFCSEAFYFMGDLAIPFLFLVLTSWIEVLPPSKDSNNFPLVKVLVQLVNLKTCNKPGYNLLPLRDLLNKFYEYPREPWNSDNFFKEIFTSYLRNPETPGDFTILLYTRNCECKWVYKKINDLMKPILEKVKNVNFKATLIVLIGHIMNPFNGKLHSEYVEHIRKWLKDLMLDETPEIVKKSIVYSLRKLPRTCKKVVDKNENKDVQSVNI